MAVLTIVRLGHPALRTPAEAVPPERITDPEMQTLVDDLVDTMRDGQGVGLAAPQVGISQQIFVWASVDPDQPVEDPPVRAIFNPAIDILSRDTVHEWEGCLSIPDLRGLVPRVPVIRLRGFDRDGARVDDRLENYEARIVQHEFDHLNGMIFLDRMRDLRSLSFGAEWEEFMTSDDEADARSVG
ncbi:MAG: peptide deformylase [Acidobacteriota bacterium]